MPFSMFSHGNLDAHAANAVLRALETLGGKASIQAIEAEVTEVGSITRPKGANPRYLYLKIHKTLAYLEAQGLVIHQHGQYTARPEAVRTAVDMALHSAERAIQDAIPLFAIERLTPSDIDRLRAALDGALGAETPRKTPEKRLPFTRKK